MGNGKGNPEEWVAVVRPGRVMYELEGVDETLAREAFHLAEHKLPVQTRVPVARRGAEMKGVRREGSAGRTIPPSCAARCASCEEDLFKHRLKKTHEPAREHDADPQHAPRHRARQHRPRRALQAGDSAAAPRQAPAPSSEAPAPRPGARPTEAARPKSSRPSAREQET